MKKGVSTEVSVILAGVFAILTVVALVVFFSQYKPPDQASQQVGNCVIHGIHVSGYVRMAKNASDAAGMITVKYHDKVISPCLVNGNLDVVYDSCFLGEGDSIILQVNEDQCNLVDTQPKSDETN